MVVATDRRLRLVADTGSSNTLFERSVQPPAATLNGRFLDLLMKSKMRNKQSVSDNNIINNIIVHIINTQ